MPTLLLSAFLKISNDNLLRRIQTNVGLFIVLRSSAGVYFDLFELVVICYICVSAIILLNVLIAMMNHRYDKAKERAENFWRFQILRIALDLELVPVLRWLFLALLRIDIEHPNVCSICCGICCCYCRIKQLKTQPAKQNRKFLKVKLDLNDWS